MSTGDDFDKDAMDAYGRAYRKIREAERDLLFAVYGDEWRPHATPDFHSRNPELLVQSASACLLLCRAIAGAVKLEAERQKAEALRRNPETPTH